jgi:hypothetical protein
LKNSLAIKIGKIKGDVNNIKDKIKIFELNDFLLIIPKIYISSNTILYV